MRRLSFLIISFLSAINLSAQSPHGKDLKYDCSYCHESTSWKVIPGQIKFNHDETGFKLLYQHAMVDCKSCHKSKIISPSEGEGSIVSLIFSEAKTDCFSCHKDVHQNTVGFNCEKCHTPESWAVKNINEIHRQTRFPLVGAHQAADCNQCHTGFKNLRFEQLNVTCYSCHSSNYRNTKTPNHLQAGFSTDCQQCHSITGLKWSTDNFIHDFFPLVGGHNIQNCFSCHTNSTFKGLSKECISCHRSNYESVKDPNHVTGNFPLDCSQCHTINSFKPASFNHSQTAFPLTGAHINVNCSSCHAQQFTGTPTACVSCHQSDYNSTNNPNHTTVGIAITCVDCHTTTAWVPSGFSHANTSFPLIGQHQQASCASCHSGTTTGLNKACISCHQNNYNAAPNHATQHYPVNCEMCHNPVAWNQTTFNHQSTAFPLTGAHVNVNCSLCHSQQFTGTPTACVSCHQGNYNTSVNPNHTALQLPTDCQSCHTTNLGWKPASFGIHDNYYQLIGAHAVIRNNCVTCHNGNYTSSPNTCYGCHQQDYNSTNNPSHQSAGFSTDCRTCHSQDAWKPSTFNHDGQYFPIYSGKHKDKWITCSECHTTSNNFAVFSCINCHEHNKSDMDSEHNGISGYTYESNACFSCHPKGDKEGAFNHSSTGFPLTGSHTSLNCQQCHQNGFANTSAACISCHQSDYNSTNNPNHTTVGIAITCVDCHTTTAWVPSGFSHANTSFPLIGQHQQASCASCHSGTTTGLNKACISCHQNNYNTAPNHATQHYPVNCEMCHNPVAWNQTTFNHQSTVFPLTGAHVNVNCSLCHSQQFTGTPTACVSCHQGNYNTSVNPNHTALQLPTDCQSCHTTNLGWKPASFGIHDNYYQLIGAHAVIRNNCVTCHNGNYTSSPNTCYGCHQQDYNSTNNPSHPNSGFSTDCQTCHSQNAWKPSTFDHDGQYFPIYSGKHKDKWITCSDCHTTSNNFTVFSCITCHEHNKSEMDNEHKGVNGYVYNSQNCYSCHPKGRSGNIMMRVE